MINDIFVCVNDIDSRDNTVKTAAKFAIEHNAKLTGLYIKIDVVNQYHAYGTFSAHLMQQVIEREKEQAEQAHADFLNITEQMGCHSDWLCVEEYEDPIESMFYTDMIFMSFNSPKKETRFSSPGYINHLLLDTGRPIVVIPEQWDENKTIGGKLMLGWNETRESSRAMHASLPLMQNAKEVDIVTVSRSTDDEDMLAKGIEASQYLTQKDVNCQLFTEMTDADRRTVGSVLLDHANKSERDLIVIGGYGHSRLRELLLGGTTRYLVHHSNIPLLLVH